MRNVLSWLGLSLIVIGVVVVLSLGEDYVFNDKVISCYLDTVKTYRVQFRQIDCYVDITWKDKIPVYMTPEEFREWRDWKMPDTINYSYPNEINHEIQTDNP